MCHEHQDDLLREDEVQHRRSAAQLRSKCSAAEVDVDQVLQAALSLQGHAQLPSHGAVCAIACTWAPVCGTPHRDGQCHAVEGLRNGGAHRQRLVFCDHILA